MMSAPQPYYATYSSLRHRQQPQCICKSTKLSSYSSSLFQKSSKRDKDLTVFERKRQKKGGKVCSFAKLFVILQCKISRSKDMFNLRDAKIEDFKVVENTQQVSANRKNVRVTFYRVKPGCHKPVAPKLEYCKLSEVL